MGLTPGIQPMNEVPNTSDEDMAVDGDSHLHADSPDLIVTPGENHAYRGTEQHGVPTEWASEMDAGDGIPTDPRLYNPAAWDREGIRKYYDPVKVEIIERDRDNIAWSPNRFLVSNNWQQILPRNTNRTKARISNIEPGQDYVVGANPAAGAQPATYQNTFPYTLNVRDVNVTFVTDATVASRLVSLQKLAPDGTILWQVAGAVQTASLNTTYNWIPGSASSSLVSNQIYTQLGMPCCPLRPGESLKVSTISLQAGDDFGAVTIQFDPVILVADDRDRAATFSRPLYPGQEIELNESTEPVWAYSNVVNGFYVNTFEEYNVQPPAQ